MSNENDVTRGPQGASGLKNWPTVDELTSAIKREVVRDIMAGVIPPTVTGYSELHDYVDANCYGGMCDDARYGHTLDDPDFAEMITNVMNQAHDRVDAWLHEGAAPHVARLDQLVSRLNQQWPEKKFGVAPEDTVAAGTGDHFPFGFGIVFLHEDMWIYHPFLSECGRFFVDPAKTYGLDDSAATEIMMANGLKNS